MCWVSGTVFDDLLLKNCADVLTPRSRYFQFIPPPAILRYPSPAISPDHKQADCQRELRQEQGQQGQSGTSGYTCAIRVFCVEYDRHDLYVLPRMSALIWARAYASQGTTCTLPAAIFGLAPRGRHCASDWCSNLASWGWSRSQKRARRSAMSCVRLNCHQTLYNTG